MRVLALHTRFHEPEGVNIVLTLHPYAVQVRTEHDGRVQSKFGKRFARTPNGSNAARSLFEALRKFETPDLYQLTKSPSQ
jgi:hypothetical protein